MARTYGLTAIRCWAMNEMIVVCAIVPKFFVSFVTDNTTRTTPQESAHNVRRDSIACAKIKGLWVALVG